MRLAGFALLFAASAGFLQAGCGDSGSDGGAGSDTSAAAVTASGEDIEIGAMLAQIRGHYRAAVERYEAGDRASAVKHAEHPAREILDSLRPDLEKAAPGSSEPLGRALRQVLAAVEANKPSRLVEDRIDSASAATVEAERQAVGETARSDSYRGSVIASLTSTAAHEYEEAVKGSRVVELIEYQDGYGFFREAAGIYRLIAPAVEERAAEEAEEIEAAFRALQKAIPSGARPPRAAPLEDVERNATLVGAELEETVGAKPAGESDPAAVRAKIEGLLDDVVASYDPAQPDRAAELVAEAYLENYELIEGAVIEAAPDVNRELEPLLGAELRKRIREGAPPAEIRSMVARAKQLLAQGVSALEEAG